VKTLLSYWSWKELAANGMILLHLLGAAITGLAIGYERTYHGRAAGMRTYSLVCMASTALTVLNGFPAQWYGGLSVSPSIADPTRVIQGIMTGIGFLGAGVIVKDHYNIRGLSTAASLWLTAAVGILIGVGFYGAATTAAVLAVMVMSGFRFLEYYLPHQSLFNLMIAYPREKVDAEDSIRALAERHGFAVVDWSYRLVNEGKRFEFNLVLSQVGKGRTGDLAHELRRSPEVTDFCVTSSRS
jgi:putative Mg2+ transporter-C (MgtC) family protein